AYSSPALRDAGWDAFKVPPAASMPGHDPNYPGDALLVLLVYAEDRSLPRSVDLEYFAVSRGGIVYWIDPHEPDVNNDRVLDELDYERFETISRGALRALDAPRPDINPEHASKNSPKRLVYRGMAPVRGASVAPTTEPEAGAGTLMVSDFAMGQSALERLVEQDRNLMDGVIPDRPQASRPSAGGTGFMLASCQYPAGFVDGTVAYRSYARVAERIGAATGIQPQFAVFVGDQVYVDPTAGLYDPAAEDDRYKLPYEAWLREPNVREVLRRIPSFMLLDDHEIDDNWEPPSDEAKKKAGLEAFRKYQRGIKRDLETFDFDGLHFFLLDTRTERTHRRVGDLDRAFLFKTGPGATMERLAAWLRLPNGPKFIASPSMFLPRHRRAVQRDSSLSPANLSALHSDGWDGYPNSLREVLGVLAAGKIRHVVFLSGDEHRGCIATARLTDTNDTLLTTIHSVHTAAMYAPYPFANGIDEDIVEKEDFEFEYGSKRYRCVVNATRPPPGDGATFLRVRREGTDWKLDCDFAGTVHTLVL
ncbi:hypothetical protein C7U60_10130, partial [Mesorhizobium plurifarium]